MAPQIITWPVGEKLIRTKEKFLRIAGINGVVGAVDGTFIPIKAPTADREVYVTRKCNYALTLQGICDADLKFTDCFVGYPGSVSDTRIFRNSHIYKDVLHNTAAFFPNEEFIIGDKAYPVTSWCMAPYINRGNMTLQQRNFNLRISQTRQCIERSFASLFGRFRRLKFLDMNRFDLIPATVLTSCVLHNICIDNNDLNNINEYIAEGLPFVHGHNIFDDNNENHQQEQPQIGQQKRNQLCEQLF